MQIIVASSIFALAYLLIIWDKFDRAIVAMSGAVLMILLNVLSQEDAFGEIDFNTIGLLISMMIVVMITKRSGVFEYLAVKMAKVAKGDPVKILMLLALITGILSAVLDNVTTILLIVPVTLSIAKDLHLNPMPIIISEVFASNVGGTATLVGDPPNIMIGSSAGLSFVDFLLNLGPIILLILPLCTVLFALMFRKKLVTTPEAKAKIMAMDERRCIKDPILLKKCLVVLILTIVGFLFHNVFHYQSATIAMGSALLLLLISKVHPEKILHEVEWKTIFFFVGLFIMVGGIKEAGAIEVFARGMINLTQGNSVLTTISILWVSAIVSAFLDNIPFVATMIPMIHDMGAFTGMNLTPVWWALSLGACLGGNGTIIGASANVIGLGMAEEHGHKISFGKYMKLAFPLMILTIAISTAYLFLFYLS
jgi:Na+/H+ antiporter NhaD/arsenite permease-like protein